MNQLQRGMIETGKTLFLVFLVLLSIFLTWLLWNHRPPFTAVEKNYTSVPPLGEEREPGQLAAPQFIYFHEAGTHRMALPFSYPHRQALEKLSEWKVRNLEAVLWEEVDWLGLRQATGIELEFGFQVPLIEFASVWEGIGVRSEQMESVTRLWVWTDEEERFWIYFLDEERQQVVRGMVEAEPSEWQVLIRSAAGLPEVNFYPVLPVSASEDGRLSPANPPSSEETSAEGEKNRVQGVDRPAEAERKQEVNRAEGTERAKGEGSGQEGSSDAAREGVSEGWYLPAEPLEVAEEVLRLEPIRLEVFYPYLFVDPSFIREIVTRDGVSVYTDGSRSLQVEPSRLRLVFDAPVAFTQAGQDNETAGYSEVAVQFVNHYGGWTGNYLLDGFQQFWQEQVRLRFRYYHGSYPVYGTSETSEDGRLLISMQPTGQVITLERPLYRLGQGEKGEVRVLPAGDEVVQHLLKLQQEGFQVKQARVAYRMELETGEGEAGRQVRLVPGWALVEASGAYRWLDKAD